MLRLMLSLTMLAAFAVAPLQAQTPAGVKRGTGKGGVPCTYENCMSNCIALSGKFCTSYCARILKERKASGVCS